MVCCEPSCDICPSVMYTHLSRLQPSQGMASQPMASQPMVSQCSQAMHRAARPPWWWPSQRWQWCRRSANHQCTLAAPIAKQRSSLQRSTRPAPSPGSFVWSSALLGRCDGERGTFDPLPCSVGVEKGVPLSDPLPCWVVWWRKGYLCLILCLVGWCDGERSTFVWSSALLGGVMRKGYLCLILCLVGYVWWRKGYVCLILCLVEWCDEKGVPLSDPLPCWVVWWERGTFVWSSALLGGVMRKGYLCLIRCLVGWCDGERGTFVWSSALLGGVMRKGYLCLIRCLVGWCDEKGVPLSDPLPCWVGVMEKGVPWLCLWMVQVLLYFTQPFSGVC